MIELLSEHQIKVFWSRVSIGNDEECWHWNGTHTELGHGCINFRVNNKPTKFQASRVAYFLINHGFDENKRLAKLCESNGCCNPRHMTPWINKANDMNDTERICITCKLIKPIAKFDMKRNRSICTNCRNKPRIEKKSQARKTGEWKAKDILINYKSNDKKKGRENDLTLEFIESKIAEGCFYCGETRRERMTLDRIDNGLGHLQSNVNACCSTCNFTRRDMPYEAWIILAPKMIEIRMLGLLENWKMKKSKQETSVRPVDAASTNSRL